jgi:hypothetical protein
LVGKAKKAPTLVEAHHKKGKKGGASYATT